MRALPLHRRWKANLRNHRKLAIFDGEVALAGGMNLARRYMGTGRSDARWVDTLVRLEGPAVRDLAAIFADDWEFATGESLEDLSDAERESRGDQVLQVVPSGPDVPHDALLDAVVAAVYKARRRLWVVTPYFVPDDGLMRALLLQARLGSDVRVILPRRSDHFAADLARARFVRRLREAGARFFVHRQRMIHAKHLLVDDALAVAGSANLDMRSLYLNYELALFGYDPHTVQTTERWMEALLGECEEYAPDEPGVVRRIAEDLCWLAAPLL
jgi:cardiolipin synthase